MKSFFYVPLTRHTAVLVSFVVFDVNVGAKVSKCKLLALSFCMAALCWVFLTFYAMSTIDLHIRAKQSVVRLFESAWFLLPIVVTLSDMITPVVLSRPHGLVEWVAHHKSYATWNIPRIWCSLLLLYQTVCYLLLPQPIIYFIGSLDSGL